jgi:hypothetical protein
MLTSEVLVKCLHKLDPEECRTHSYSGRAAFGQLCVGVQGSTVSEALAIAFKAISDGIEDADECVDAMTLLAQNLRYDNMGLGMMVYFPRLKWTEECQRILDSEESGNEGEKTDEQT